MEQIRCELSSAEKAASPAESNSFATIEHLEQELKDVLGALALLGMSRCSQCKQFFRAADPGALFDGGQPVCFACIPEWWSVASARMAAGECERIAAKLASWLRKHHQAVIVKEANGQARKPAVSEFQMTVKCQECSGSGKLLEGERCRFCIGLGTVRVVVPEEG